MITKKMYYVIGLAAMVMLLIMGACSGSEEKKKPEQDAASPVEKEEVKKEAPVEIVNDSMLKIEDAWLRSPQAGNPTELYMTFRMMGREYFNVFKTPVNLILCIF